MCVCISMCIYTYIKMSVGPRPQVAERPVASAGGPRVAWHAWRPAASGPTAATTAAAAGAIYICIYIYVYIYIYIDR